MKTRRTLSPLLTLVVLFLSFSSPLQSQSISEKLGAVTTDFEFYSDTIKIKVTQQQLVKKAVAEKRIYLDDIYSNGIRPYGYNSIHFEFKTEERLRFFKEKWGKNQKDFFKFVLCKADGEILFTKYFLKKDISIYHNPATKSAIYSIDLKDIPMLVFNDAQKVIFSRVLKTRRP